MIKEESLEEIREILKKSENPIFFYDDDNDGLCSYLLFRRFLGKGKGVVIKSSPKLDESYVRKVKENRPDYVFIFDKPMVSQDFVDKIGVPIIWIDHHDLVKVNGVRYYNPKLEDSEDNRPVSYWSYKVVKQDLWIAMLGIVGDWYLPEFLDEFCDKYPDLLSKDVKDPGDALYGSEFGKLSKIFSFVLKGRVSDVNKLVSVLMRIDDPYEILEQKTPKGKYVYKYFEKVNKQYESLLAKAIKSKSKDKFLVFLYPSGKMSFTGDLANELLYKFPDKIIIIGREKDGMVRLSLRSTGIELPKKIMNSLVDVEGHGGGHKFACGANIKKDDLQKFIDNFKKQIK